MTRRSYLPFDVPRCDGVLTDNIVATPCDTCARREFRHQVSEWRQAWIEGVPVAGYCRHYISIDYDETRFTLHRRV